MGLRVSVGIPSYNEGLGLLRVLKQLVSQRLRGSKIKEVIVSDDSDDETPKLVEEFQDKVKPPYELILLHHERRRGVASAWNEIFSTAKGDAVILYDADISLEPDTSANLLKPLTESKEVGLAASNTIPSRGRGIAGRASAAVAKWLRIIRMRYPQSQFTVMGRGVAARAELIEKVRIPRNVLAVDLYLQCAAHKLGWKVAYVDEARVYFKPSETFRDFTSQIVRAYFGHRQIERLVEESIPEKLGLKEQFRCFLEVMTRYPRDAPATITSYIMTPIFFPRLFPKACKAVWDIAASTKKCQDGYQSSSLRRGVRITRSHHP